MYRSLRQSAIWLFVIMAAIVPVALSATSPQLQWREPIYQIAGFSGVLGLALMLVQPLLAAGYLPWIRLRTSRKWHRFSGVLLVFCVVTHVATLWITSPPDVVDALLFVSAVSFSVWGVVAMWAVFAAAVLAALRRTIAIRLRRFLHTLTVSIAILATIVHALLIEGTMEQTSKAVLCILVALIGGKVMYDLKAWTALRRRSSG